MEAKKIKVTLILANRVSEELKLLAKAEADRESRSKAKAVAVAKRRVRESIAIQVLPNSQDTKMVSSVVFEIYKQHFRDVGNNTFVYDENTIKKVVSVLSKLSTQQASQQNKERENESIQIRHSRESSHC